MAGVFAGGMNLRISSFRYAQSCTPRFATPSRQKKSPTKERAAQYSRYPIVGLDGAHRANGNAVSGRTYLRLRLVAKKIASGHDDSFVSDDLELRVRGRASIRIFPLSWNRRRRRICGRSWSRGSLELTHRHRARQLRQSVRRRKRQLGNSQDYC